jgi:NAD dependent epimerase/dehydratase
MNLRNSRVLVTGGDGFIGSHLVERLVDGGARVVALAHYNAFNNWGWLEDISCLSRVDVVTGDIRDAHFCRELTTGMEVVFHLAALIAIPYSYAAAESYVDTNVKGTLHLCQAALASGVKKLVHTSTSEVYGTAQYVPMDERHPLNAQSPYSATKIGADAVAMSFHHAFQLPVVIARPFNTYGPRQSARAVIPTIISQLASGPREIRLGELTPTRDFTFVEDTCRGLLAIAQLDAGIGDVFHIGSNREIAVGDLFALLADIMGSSARVLLDETRRRPETSEVLRLRCDNRKLRDASGFEPEIGLRDGLTRTVRWFADERNLQRYKRGLYNV